MTCLTIVIDPLLFFSPIGLPLIEALSKVATVWIPRELRNVLKNNYFFVQNPEHISVPIDVILTSSESVENLENVDNTIRLFKQSIHTSLRQWTVFQEHHDLSQIRLFWLGDNLQESLLPKGQDTKILGQTEWLAANLDTYIRSSHSALEKDSIIINAFRDATALATSLQNCLILSCQDPYHPQKGSQPSLCSFYNKFGILVKEANADDPVTVHHRNYIFQLLIQTGIAKLLWSLKLFAIHLISPLSSISSSIPGDSSLSLAEISLQKSLSEYSFNWQNTSAIWHHI